MKNVFGEPDEWDREFASHPPFDRKHLRTIELALRAAWDRLHKDYATAREISDANEGRISLLLREALDDVRNLEVGGVDGYTPDAFETPQVGAEMTTPEGKIRKPDIIFKLVGRRRSGVSKGTRDAIIVECKILQTNSKSRTVANYCKHGIRRFVEGAYAAYMREGMMIAYVRATLSLPDGLAKMLRTREMKDYLATDGELSKCSLTRTDPRAYVSVHRRDWPYPGTEDYPGPIEIRHLWLHV